MKDLFGREVEWNPDAPAMSDAERKRMYRRAASVPRGHAAPPGTGPAGEFCRTCEHYTLRQFSKTYRKCGLMRDAWSGGPKTDIRASDPACKRWEKATDEEAA